MLSTLVRDEAKKTGSEVRRWKTITCYQRLVQAGNVWVCKMFPRTWYTGCDSY